MGLLVSPSVSVIVTVLPGNAFGAVSTIQLSLVPLVVMLEPVQIGLFMALLSVTV
jgi:hypothetical protein